MYGGHLSEFMKCFEENRLIKRVKDDKGTTLKGQKRCKKLNIREISKTLNYGVLTSLILNKKAKNELSKNLFSTRMTKTYLSALLFY